MALQHLWGHVLQLVTMFVRRVTVDFTKLVLHVIETFVLVPTALQ
jgi:hypothetical protein